MDQLEEGPVVPHHNTELLKDSSTLRLPNTEPLVKVASPRPSTVPRDKAASIPRNLELPLHSMGPLLPNTVRLLPNLVVPRLSLVPPRLSTEPHQLMLRLNNMVPQDLEGLVVSFLN